MKVLPEGTRVKLAKAMDECKPLVDVPIGSTGTVVATWDTFGGGYCIEWDKKEYGKHSFDSGTGHRLLLEVDEGVA